MCSAGALSFGSSSRSAPPLHILLVHDPAWEKPQSHSVTRERYVRRGRWEGIFHSVRRPSLEFRELLQICQLAKFEIMEYSIIYASILLRDHSLKHYVQNVGRCDVMSPCVNIVMGTPTLTPDFLYVRPQAHASRSRTDRCMVRED